MAVRREAPSIHGLLTSRNTADARAPAQGGAGSVGLPMEATPERVPGIIQPRSCAHPRGRIPASGPCSTLRCAPQPEGMGGCDSGREALVPEQTHQPCSTTANAAASRPFLLHSARVESGAPSRARRCCSLLIWAGQMSSLAPSRSSKSVSIARVNAYEIGSGSSFGVQFEREELEA
jgi:hypothetical protein